MDDILVKTIKINNIFQKIDMGQDIGTKVNH
jgi:hypothetical protein